MIKNFNKSKLIKINSKNFSKGGLSFIEEQHLKFKIKEFIIFMIIRLIREGSC